jgi:hypothetical protein
MKQELMAIRKDGWILNYGSIGYVEKDTMNNLAEPASKPRIIWSDFVDSNGCIFTAYYLNNVFDKKSWMHI